MSKKVLESILASVTRVSTKEFNDTFKTLHLVQGNQFEVHQSLAWGRQSTQMKAYHLAQVLQTL